MHVPLTLMTFLERAVTAYGDRIGIVDEPLQPAGPLGGAGLTWREVGDLAERMAARLDEWGIGEGERVAIVSHNSARLAVAYFGVAGSGRILVPVNFRLRPDEIAYILEDSGAKVLLVDPELDTALSDLGREGSTVEHRIVLGDDEELFAPAGARARRWEGDENTTATINYTSGTTARPKGVELTHRALWTNATTFGLHVGLSDRDVLLKTLPTFHVNGWGMPFVGAGLGVKQIELRKVDGAEILRRIEQHGVTVLCGAPAVAAAVLDAAAEWDGPIPGRDKVRMIMAGAPPPTRTVARMEEELGWEFIQIYGLTETSPLVTINRSRAEWDGLSTHERAKRLGRAGAPALGVRVTTDVDGEVLTQSNHNLKGYWEQPDATAEAQQGNWFHTGDGGLIDDDNYLVISDRKKDVIISGGENVSSIEVEDALMSHDAVKEVAVIGIPDEKWGELVTALVVTDGSEVSAADLIAHCRENLAGYKCPKRVEFVESLPRTATGKLQKFKLRESYWADRDRQVN
ncbi:AMP-binding protein [Nocardioides sp.]|uniref:AMP-binding protein n=1 Tax=Nocardioides sp. TaxID=35761 RepID=UPI00263405B3|nr:AMP-binding protein [Nocardioides sp.]